MKFRVDVIKTDDNGNEIGRVTADEYLYEFEAIERVMTENQKLKESGENGHVHMHVIEEEGDRKYHEEPEDSEEDTDYTTEEFLQFEYDRVKDDNWQTVTFKIEKDEQKSVDREEHQKALLELIDESPIHKLISVEKSTEEEIKEKLAETYENYKPMKLQKKLRPLTMRWAYDGGGIACGPVEGSTITEIMFHDDDNCPYFVSATRMSEFVNVYVSEVSLFALLLWLGIGNSNVNDYMQKIAKYSVEEYETELGGYDQILDSKYRDEMILVLTMNNYYIHHDYENPSPEEMLDVFRGNKLNIGLPMGWYDEDEMEDED